MLLASRAKAKNAEVDYVVSRGELIAPVEVKAGKSGTLRSLQQFALYKKTGLAVRFDLNPISCQRLHHPLHLTEGQDVVEYSLLSLPLYLVGQLGRLLDQYRTSCASTEGN